MKRVLNIDGFPGVTQKVTCSDTSTELTLPTVAGLSPIGALITIEDYGCRLAFGTDASITLGHKLSAGQSFKLHSPQECSDLRHINSSVGDNSVLMITYYYAN